MACAIKRKQCLDMLMQMVRVYNAMNEADIDPMTAVPIEEELYQQSIEMSASTEVQTQTYIRTCLRAAGKLWHEGALQETQVINTQYRTRYIEAFTQLLAGAGAGDDQATALATAIEASCFRAVLHKCRMSSSAHLRSWDSDMFVNMYSVRCGMIYATLDRNSVASKTYGTALLDQLLAGKLSPDSLGTMESTELSPDALKKERKEIEIRQQQTIAPKASGMFQCPNCKERKCQYREVQIRSSDEPPDYFCTCLKCGVAFKGR